LAEPVAGQCRQRSPVKRAVEGDEAVALRVALGGVILAGDLDRAFHRLGAEFAKNTKSAKLCSHSRAASRSPSGLRNRFDMCHSLVGLLLKRCDQMRMGMAQRIHRDAGGEIEIALAVGRDQPGALAALEPEIHPGEYGKQMRGCAVGHGDH